MNGEIESKIKNLLELNKTKELTTRWTENDINLKLNSIEVNNDKVTEHSELIAYMYQGAGLKINDKSKELFSKSYDVWKVIWYSAKETDINKTIKKLFYLVSTGVLCDSLAEVRMILIEINLNDYYKNLDKKVWDIYLENTIYLILLVLIRKANGWEDIKFIESILSEFKKDQEQYEEDYLKSINESNRYSCICWLAALLNILGAIEEYKKYLLEGKPDDIEKVIIRYCKESYELIDETNKSEKKFLFILIEKVLIKMVTYSVWSSINGISEKIDNYIKLLTMRDTSKPIFELWPSQQQAISKNLFDNTKTSIVVQMPTSAGKTMLAKFYILQTFNLYTKPKVAYIVPTRALVNQIKKDLKNDFNRLGIKVEISIPYSDIEDMEDELLLQDTDIIVTTPEKLDILLKVKHPIVENLKLVIVDEAHGLQDESGGAKLELLLAMLRKNNRNLRVLMLSPFIENALEISQWLGGSRGLEIHVDWKPSQQFTGIYELKTIKKGKHVGEITYIPSSLNTMYSSEFKIHVHECSNKGIGKGEKAVKVAELYRKLGGVLILCRTKKDAESAARECSEISCELSKEKLLQLDILLNLIEVEMGNDCLLYQCIKKGIAYHHSSLPLIIREEIEEAISKQLITIVSATTTLAQGMNFPISTVIFQSMNVPLRGNMTSAEFWNIAGRAGRALVDKEGHIISISDNDKDKDLFKNYLAIKNKEVLSSLISMLKYIPEDEINGKWIREYSTLSALLQYIYHIILVDPNIEIEDLLRGSLVYYQLREVEHDDLAEKLIRLTKNYIYTIDKDLKSKKLMESIDKTGLSSVSMHMLLAKLNKRGIEIDSSTIFEKDNTTLRELIEIVNSIPEINLGIFDRGNFSSELVAQMTKQWVEGKSIREIAEGNLESEKDTEERLNICGNYIYSRLINNLPWGISAIQRINGILKKSEDMDTIIPSYIYFGVKTKEAVALSMLGVPRFAANIIGEYWIKNDKSINMTKLESVKTWLNNVNEEQWVKCFNDKEKGKLAYNIWMKQK